MFYQCNCGKQLRAGKTARGKGAVHDGAGKLPSIYVQVLPNEAEETVKFLHQLWLLIPFIYMWD